MSSTPIDAYLAKLPEPQQSTLRELRVRLRKLLPLAEECISYNMPAFRSGGIVIAGFAGFKNHCSYFPHSGSVVPALGSRLKAFDADDGTVRFPTTKPLPLAILRLLVKERLKQESEKVTRNGKAHSFYENGVLRFSGQYKAGKMHGAWKFFRKDGSLMRSGPFKLGEQSGTWITWGRAGERVKETKF
jgi:uncharacterized protein YdhG (YjbR/CyaY superfamily)